MVWVDVTEVGSESVGVLDVDGFTWAEEGVESVEGDESDGGHREERERERRVSAK